MTKKCGEKTGCIKGRKRKINVNVLEKERCGKRRAQRGKKQQMKSFKFMSVMLK